MDYYKESLRAHEAHKGKLEVRSKLPMSTKDDLSIAYTPGVAEPCRAINKDADAAYRYTIKSNSVAVVTDGSAVLGLGNIGAIAGLPVMEGKAVLFKEFAGIDAYPICIDSQDTEKIIETVRLISPGFGGVNLEDISSPRCFEIEARLKEMLSIPVFHDDQHGTAIVTLAGLFNALRIAGKRMEDIRIVVNGAGASAIAVSKFILGQNPRDLILCDSKGIIHRSRTDLNDVKKDMLRSTNKDDRKGTLADALKGYDVFIGLSAAGALKGEMVRSMAQRPIIFAMANPEPEIFPDEAFGAGAFIVATGRSDFPNQINNVLGFPGIFRGALDCRASEINEEMKIAAAKAIADIAIPHLSKDHIIPSPLDRSVVPKVAEAVKRAAYETKVARI